MPPISISPPCSNCGGGGAFTGANIALACANAPNIVATVVAINKGVATNAPGPVAVADVVAPAIPALIDLAVSIPICANASAF